MFNESVGIPVTVTGSLNVIWIRISDPIPYEPLGRFDETDVMLGAVASISIGGTGVLELLVFPDQSVDFAVNTYDPLVSVEEVQLQLPATVANVVPTAVVPAKIVTLEPASAVPVKIGVCTFVRPLGEDKITGAAGATESALKADGLEK